MACEEGTTSPATGRSVSGSLPGEPGRHFRGSDGIEFPVLAEDAVIRQGVAVVIGYLHAGVRLDGFIGRSDLSKGWVRRAACLRR